MNMRKKISPALLCFSLIGLPLSSFGVESFGFDMDDEEAVLRALQNNPAENNNVQLAAVKILSEMPTELHGYLTNILKRKKKKIQLRIEERSTFDLEGLPGSVRATCQIMQEIRNEEDTRELKDPAVMLVLQSDKADKLLKTLTCNTLVKRDSETTIIAPWPNSKKMIPAQKESHTLVQQPSFSFRDLVAKKVALEKQKKAQRKQAYRATKALYKKQALTKMAKQKYSTQTKSVLHQPR